MKNPLHTSHHTESDLRRYVHYRKNELIKDAEKYLEAKAKQFSEEQLYELRTSALSIEKANKYELEVWEGGNQLGHALGRFEDDAHITLDAEFWTHTQLSTGGDGDGFITAFSANHEEIQMVYYWEDWGVREFIKMNNYDMMTIKHAIWEGFIESY